MLIHSDKICSVFNKVRVIRERLAEAHRPVSLVMDPHDLHWAVQDVYGLNVEMIEVRFQANHVAGKVERYTENRARILVRSTLQDDMKRFVTVKELSHLVIDEKDDWSTLGVETIRGLLVEWKMFEKDGEGNRNPTNQLQSEYLAEIAATEFMYPFEYREADMAKVASGESDIDRIAFEHDIPPFAIEMAFEHHETFSQVWSSIDLAKAA